jgi:hypothetical protein
VRDDELVQKLKREWGLTGPPLVAVPLKSLLHVIGLTHKSLGAMQTLGLLMGEQGTGVLREADRTERMLNYHLDDLAG